MNKSKVKEMILFSLYKNIQNKWFVIFNIVTLVSTIIILNWGNFANIINTKTEDKTFNIAVLDNVGLIYDEFEKDLSDDKKFVISKIERNDYTEENIPDDFMIVEISEDIEEIFHVTIISKEGIYGEYYNPVKGELLKIRNDLLAKRYALDNNVAEILQRDMKIDRKMLGVNAEDSSTKEIVKFFSSALIYIITVFIFSKMANEIASEKQSKSVEYVLTTVSEKEYLFSKISSSILWLLIQGLFIVIYYYIALLISNLTQTIDVDLSVMQSLTLNSFNKEIVFYIFTLIVYGILNLILLCIIQATLASKTSSTTEASNTTAFLLIVMFIGYALTLIFLRPAQKVSLLLYIISCIPILSAYFIPGMIVIGQATIWQIIISLFILVASIPAIFNYCAKIFKNGILDYTKVKKNNNKKDNNFLVKREMQSFGFVIGIAIIIYAGTQTIFYLLGAVVMKTLFNDVLLDVEINMILQLLLQVFSLGLSASFVFAHTEKNNNILYEERQTSLKSKIKIILIALFLVFALQIILSLVLYPLLGLDYDTTDLFKVNNSSRLLSKIILVITLAVTPAIFEELFFRKAIINFSMKYGKVFALLFSSLLFGLLHMNLSQGLFAFIMGLIFGSIYLYSGSVKYSMLVHFLNNGFAALCLVLSEMWVVALTASTFIVITIGFVLLVKMIVNKESREKLVRIAKIKVDMKKFEEKYQYVFKDYAFDLSLVFAFLMTVITEKILR